MCRTIKFILISMIICLGLGIGLITLAQEDTAIEPNEEELIEEVALDEEVSAEDLEVKEPRLLPDSPFYFLKNWGRGIQSFFTFNRVKKIELESRFANERLIELKKLTEKKKGPEILKKAAENYKRTVERIRSQAEKIKEKAIENPEIDKFLNKFTNHQLLHQKLLQKLETQVPTEAFEKIKEVRERHLEKFGEVMIKLEDREEKIKEKIENAFEEQEGSKFKNFKNLEVLIELEEKVPEQAKEAIRKVQENALKRLHGDLEKMSPEDQERFKDYTDKISGEKENQLEILENLKFELKENPALEAKIKEAKERILEKVQERTRTITCSVIEKPSPNFCEQGRIIVKRDEKGCVIDFKCVIPAELEISPKPTEPKPVCITLWDPVCGVDGKTYSNNCYAKVAGVEIAYQGKCREKECQTDADCPQPRCGPTGTISARCIGVKTKCVEGECVVVEIKPE